MTDITAEKLASYIDHTLLKPTAVRSEIELLCKQAIEYGFCSVCINPRWIPLAAELLKGSKVKVCSVIGFPFGAELTKIKAVQTKVAIFAGADEIDMVADLAAVIDGDSDYLFDDLRAVVKVCHSMRPPVALKVIIEAAALTVPQKEFVCKIANRAGADFVKTSTGLHQAGGATVEDVALMKANAGHCRVKAAGGIRTLEQALAMIEAGAERIGTSAGVAIIEQLKQEQAK